MPIFNLQSPAHLWREMADNPEPLRQALQTVVAVAAAYGSSRLLGLPSPSWAVFSAIFVLQSSIGGTVRAAIDRVIGAMIGMAIGLVCLYTIGFGGWRTFASLAISIGSMTLVAGYRPRYAYGLVAVTMLVVAPDYELIESALLRAAAIGLGSLCGTLAGVLVWPVRAHRRARTHLGRAIERCADLLYASMGRAQFGKDANLDTIHDAISSEMHRAQDMITQTRKRERIGPRTGHNSRMRREIDRLWYTLALADRSSSRPMAQDALQQIGEPAEHASAICCKHLHAFGRAYSESKELPDPQDAKNAIAALLDAMKAMREQHATLPLDLGDVERLFTLSFAWEQLADNIQALSDAADGKQ